MNCYDEAVEKGFDVGEALFTQHFFFTDSNQLYNQECQNLIKKYIYLYHYQLMVLLFSPFLHNHQNQY